METTLVGKVCRGKMPDFLPFLRGGTIRYLWCIYFLYLQYICPERWCNLLVHNPIDLQPRAPYTRSSSPLASGMRLGQSSASRLTGPSSLAGTVVPRTNSAGRYDLALSCSRFGQSFSSTTSLSHRVIVAPARYCEHHDRVSTPHFHRALTGPKCGECPRYGTPFFNVLSLEFASPCDANGGATKQYPERVGQVEGFPSSGAARLPDISFFISPSCKISQEQVLSNSPDRFS